MPFCAATFQRLAQLAQAAAQLAQAVAQLAQAVARPAGWLVCHRARAHPMLILAHDLAHGTAVTTLCLSVP